MKILAAARIVPRFGRAVTIKAVLPLTAAGATLLGGTAVAVPSIVASVNGAQAVASAPGMYYGAHPNMYYG